MEKWGEAVAPTAALIPKSASAPLLVSLLFLLPKPAQASRWVRGLHDPNGMRRDYANFVHEELLLPHPSGHPSVNYTATPGPSTILLSVRPPVFQVA